MAPAHAGADRVPYIIEQVNIKIAAKEEETVIIVQVTIEITGDSNTLGGGIPRYIVGVRTRFFQATVEEHNWDVYQGKPDINFSNLNCAVTQKQFWRLSGVVASKLELEALSEAAGPYAEGVGDVDVPAAGGAVASYCGSGRDIQYPSVICGCRWHGRQRQARQSEHHGTNHYSARAHH